MIEEAAGTRLYETKKEAAQKTIEKKDAKLREIDTVSVFFSTNFLINTRSCFIQCAIVTGLLCFFRLVFICYCQEIYLYLIVYLTEYCCPLVI